MGEPRSRRGARGRRSGRISHWDRPPPPHDVRWVVSLVGKVFVVTGLLMLAFVAYQLWGTGIETSRAQRSLESEFDELLASAPPTATSPTVQTSPDTRQDPNGDPRPTTATSATSSTSDGGSPPTGTATTNPRTGATSSAPVTAAPAPASAGVAFVEEGDAIARLEMPAIGADWIVVAGIDRSDLQRGPGHYPGTPMPGQLGNSAIAGHRTTYGEPFADIDELAPGDELVVTTVAGTYVYLVEGTQIVGPDDGYVVATSDPDVARLTLTSCHPRYSASQRIVVSARLAQERSSSPGEPVIDYGRPAASGDETAGELSVETLPGEPSGDPRDGSRPGVTSPDVTSPDVTSPDVTTPDRTSPDVTSPGSASERTTPNSPGAGTPPRADDASADAFGEGWFSEPGAFVHVALWGALLAAIAAGGYVVSWRYRNDWIGPLVAATPFVVVLYFFFQNVNRLLPAAL